MRLIRCGWQIWKGISPASRQIRHLRIRTAHGISIEMVYKSETFLGADSYYLQKTSFFIFDRGAVIKIIDDNGGLFENGNQCCK